MMELPGIDLSKVSFPETQGPREQMETWIRELAAEGYTTFETVKRVCLNFVESPDPDWDSPPGLEQVDWWHDCEPDKVKTHEYWDITLYAGK